MGNYQSLRVWGTAHNLVLAVYSTSRSFPSEEMFGLTGQMRRAAVSVAANLAEGSGRDSDRELARYGRIALGSICELEYYILLSRELGYFDQEQGASLLAMLGDTKRMLARLCSVLSAKPPRRTRSRSPEAAQAVTED